jgi:large subunit ribosomal protein L10
MPRPEKVQAVADIKERLQEARAVFMAEYSGLSVKEQQALRRALRGAESEFKVFKMTLARLAASELGHDGMLDLLAGPTGLTFAKGDAAATAKVLRDFSKDHAHLIIKGALLGNELLAPERVAVLADLEPRDVLLARVAAAFKAPMAAMAGLMAAMPRNLASMIKQLADKAPAPAAEPPADEPASPPEGSALVETGAEATSEEESTAETSAAAEEAASDGEATTTDESTADQAGEE